MERHGTSWLVSFHKQFSCASVSQTDSQTPNSTPKSLLRKDCAFFVFRYHFRCRCLASKMVEKKTYFFRSKNVEKTVTLAPTEWPSRWQNIFVRNFFGLNRLQNTAVGRSERRGSTILVGSSWIARARQLRIALTHFCNL